MIIFVYAMKQLGVPIVRKRALNTTKGGDFVSCTVVWEIN